MARNILETIVQTKQEELRIQRSEIPLEQMRQLAAAQMQTGTERDFYSALAIKGQKAVNIIAEIKKASPSAGIIREDFDVAWIAGRYEAAGANALSILTDEQYFKGSLDYLQTARKVCSLPILRKDFMIHPYQVYQAKAAGADAILLIAAILTDDLASELLEIAKQLSLSCLIEVHDGAELERMQALEAIKTHGRCLMGINNRNLKTFVTDIETTVSLAEKVDPKHVLVSESGIRSDEDVQKLASCGARAILVGETLMRHEDPADGVKVLLG